MHLSINQVVPHSFSVGNAACEAIEVVLPAKIKKLDESLFYLHRKIEALYGSLPWLDEIQNIAVMTEIKGGRGDISAAAKTVDIMQRAQIYYLTGFWIATIFLLPNPSCLTTILPKFASENIKSQSPEKDPADLVIVGPVTFTYSADACESLINREIAGPIFGFMEIAKELHSFYHSIPVEVVKKATQRIVSQKFIEIFTSVFSPDNQAG